MTALKLDEARINAAAVAQFEAIYPRLVDYRGSPNWELAGLNPAAGPRRLKRFRRLDRQGGWSDLDGNASGRDLIALVEYLGQTSRERAVEFLAGIVAAAA